MGYLYNGSFKDSQPDRKAYKKGFSVDEDDIFLEFSTCEIRQKDILITYLIKYFSTPVPVENYRFKSLINMNSLKKAVVSNLNKEERSITILKLDTEKVVLNFDVKKYLHAATYPNTKVSRKRGDGSYKLKLTKPLPKVISQSCLYGLPEVFDKVMTSILTNDSSYSKVFKGSFSNEFIFNRTQPFKYFDIKFIPDKLEFEVTIKNSMIYMLYYSSRGK